MEKVGIYLIRRDDLIAVMDSGLRMLIAELKEGETHSEAAVRVLANSAPCRTTGNPVFVITEKLNGANLYVYAVRAADTAGLTLAVENEIIPQMACSRLRESERTVL